MIDSLCPLPSGSIVAAYFRDSGGADQEQSVDQQMRAALDYCGRHGLTLPDTLMFADRAQSGRSTEARPAFFELIAALDTTPRPCDGLLLWSSARFARNTNDSQFYKALLRRQGYTIIHLSGDVPDAGPLTPIFEAAVDWKNQQYIDDLRKETKRGMMWVAERGAWQGRAPVGYVKVRREIGVKRDGRPRLVGMLEIDPGKAPLVRRAFELRAEGASYDDIHRATRLYREDHPTHYGRMLRNEVYTGVHRHAGQAFAGHVEPIIDRGLWERVQEVQRARAGRAGVNHPRRVGSAYLLTGLLKCARCGRPLYCSKMRSTNVRKDGSKKVYQYPYYRCSGRYSGHCRAMVGATKLDAAVLRQLYDDVLSPEAVAGARERLREQQRVRASAEGDLAAAKRMQLAEAERGIANLVTSAERAPLSERLASRLTELEQGAQSLRVELEMLAKPRRVRADVGDLEKWAKDVTESLAFRDTGRARRAIAALVAEIQADSGAVTITYRALEP